MLRRRHGMVGSAALLVGLTTLALIDRASAQYYCDERYPASCQTYREPPYREPPPRLPFPFGLFQPREMAPAPEPAPRPYSQQPYSQEPYSPQQPGYQSPGYQPAQRPSNVAPPLDPTVARQYAALYAPVNGEPYPVPGIRLSDIDPGYLRKSVYYPNSEAPGTIIIDAQNRFLYFVQGGGRAIRYGVGVGRQGFGWSGVAEVKNKQEWPDWYPPKEMIARQADLRRQLSELQSGLGMPGGPRNPLGARAMYLWQGNKDTLYRIHGTFEPWTIGQNVSSGCIRMINQDVIDLYERVPLGAKVVVLPARS
jgi:lipoprotein-anchoring transpeptidase ErfK/SrfK